MKIAIVTSLYPEDKHETVRTTSFALKELVEGLLNYNIEIQCIFIPKPLIEWHKFRIKRETSTVIDCIQINVKTFFRLPKSKFIITKTRLESLAKELQGIDMIVAHLSDGAEIAHRLYREFKIPYIYVLHNSDLLQLEKNRDIVVNAEGIYTRSWALKKKLESQKLRVDGVVFSGIEKSLIIKREHVRKCKRLVSVHLLQKLKNTDTTLRALAMLPNHLEWEYTIIGDGEERKNLEVLIKTLGLEKRVSLIGFKQRSECIEYMRQSDVFLMPSAPETFGLAYLEAMASGCIVVGAKGWGIDGLIKNGKNGYLVKAGDKEEISRVLHHIFTTDQTNVYQNSFKTISKYTLEKAQENYANIIQMIQTKKEKYKVFCQKEAIPLFSQPWWLDTVCGEKNWDVLLYEKGGKVVASFPYYKKKRGMITLVTMPKLTQTLGPYIVYPKNQRYRNRLSWEKEVIQFFIERIPKVNYIGIQCHHTFTNWLPFYWRGYEQTTKYTYIIDRKELTGDIDHLLETDVKRRRRKAEEAGVKVYRSDDVKSFYRLNEMTFSRQGKVIPYSFDFVENLYKVCKKYQSVEILLAQNKKAEIIAGAFLVHDKDTVYYLMGGMDSDKRDLGGMDMVLIESIKFALVNHKNFDFEGSMIESIERYFRNFGARQVPYFYIQKTNSMLLKIRNIFKVFS